LVVDEDVIELRGGGHLCFGGGKTTLQVGFAVSVAGAEAGFEGGEVGHGDEDEDGAGDLLPEGACALDVGADDDGAALSDEVADLVAGDTGAMAVDVGVFEEAFGGEEVVEFGVGEKQMMDAVLLTTTGGARLGGDDAGEPGVAVEGIAVEGGAKHGVLADPGGAREDDDERLR